MDGLDLSGILGKLQTVLPIISYVINMFTRLLEVFGFYLDIDLTDPTQEAETTEAEG